MASIGYRCKKYKYVLIIVRIWKQNWNQEHSNNSAAFMDFEKNRISMNPGDNVAAIRRSLFKNVLSTRSIFAIGLRFSNAYVCICLLSKTSDWNWGTSCVEAFK